MANLILEWQGGRVSRDTKFLHLPINIGSFTGGMSLRRKFLRVLSLDSPNFLLGHANRPVKLMGPPSPHPQLQNLGCPMPPAKICNL